MKMPFIVFPILALAGCASTESPYLNTISLEIPESEYGDRTERVESGKATTGQGPYFDDFPPSRTIVFRNRHPYGSFDIGRADFFVRLYDLKDISQDRTISRYVSELKKVLLQRRDARELGDPYTSLPDFPPRNAGHLVQEKVQYVDFPWGEGVFYVCAFTQGPGNFPNNDELYYLFQGLSRDGRLYVSAELPVVSALIENTPTPDYDDASINVDDAAKDLARKLDGEPDSAFSPDLATIRSWIGSLEIPKS